MSNYPNEHILFKDINMELKASFALLGDSHTRSYKESNYLATRIFLAQGRKNNFKNNLHLVMTTYRYIRVAFKLRKSGLKLAFVVGEPDVRWLTYGKWDLGRSENDVLNSKTKLDIDNVKLQKLMSRINTFLFVTRKIKLAPAVLIGSGSPNPEMFQASLIFNKKLADLSHSHSCLFFDPQFSSAGGDGKVKEEFVGYSVFNPDQRDHTHLSTVISENFDVFLADYIDTGSHKDNHWKVTSKFDQLFVEINNFDTYKLKDGFIFKMLRAGVRFLKKKRMAK